jgi:hypothetical protein
MMPALDHHGAATVMTMITAAVPNDNSSGTEVGGLGNGLRINNGVGGHAWARTREQTHSCERENDSAHFYYSWKAAPLKNNNEDQSVPEFVLNAC